MKRLSAYESRNRWVVLVAAALLPLSVLAQSAPSDEEIAQAVTRELAFSHSVPVDRVDVQVEHGMVSLSGTVPTLVAHDQAESIAASVRGVAAIENRIDVQVPEVAAAKLKMQVEDAIARNSATDAYEVDVEAAPDGTVMLSGTVDSWTEKSLAQTVASSVRGVKRIENQIEVDDSRYYRAAEEIRADIYGRYRWNAGIDESQIDILVQDGGRVTLSGEVGSLAEKRLAITLAHVEGVKQVDADHIDIVM